MTYFMFFFINNKAYIPRKTLVSILLCFYIAISNIRPLLIENVVMLHSARPYF